MHYIDDVKEMRVNALEYKVNHKLLLHFKESANRIITCNYMPYSHDIRCFDADFAEGSMR